MIHFALRFFDLMAGAVLSGKQGKTGMATNCGTSNGVSGISLARCRSDTAAYLANTLFYKFSALKRFLDRSIQGPFKIEKYSELTYNYCIGKESFLWGDAYEKREDTKKNN